MDGEGRLAPLRERPFRLLFLGQSASVLGDAVSGIALAFAVLELGGGATGLGVVLAAGTVPFLVFLLVGGVVADRLPRRGVMVVSDVVRFAAQAAAAALVLSGSAAVWQLAVLNAVRGTASAFFTPAAVGLVPRTISPPLLQRANALRSLTGSGAWIVGPLLGGALVAGAGAGWAIAADAASYAASAWFLSRIAIPVHEPLATQRWWADARDGWRSFVEHDWVWVTVFSLTVINFFGTAFYVLGPVMARRSLGGAGAWAVILAAGGIGALAGGVLVYRIRPRRPLFVAAAAVSLGALPSLLLSIPAATAPIALATLIAGGGALVFNTLWETTLQQRIDPAALSRVSAYDYLASGVASPVGYALAGPLAAALGLRTALLVAGIGEFASIMFMLSRSSVRRLTRVPDR